MLLAVGPDWGRGESAAGPAPAGAAALAGERSPAALALFEDSSLRITSLGNLPGLAVFNGTGGAGAPRWRLPTEGLFRLLARRLPAAEHAGWSIVAVDPDSLRQAEALAPRLAALVPPGGAPSPPAAPGPRLSLGVWLDPEAALRIVSRIRRFVEEFPLASRRQVELWRDWETVLEPLANCNDVTLTSTAAPPSLRLLLHGCVGPGPR